MATQEERPFRAPNPAFRGQLISQFSVHSQMAKAMNTFRLTEKGCVTYVIRKGDNSVFIGMTTVWPPTCFMGA
jgi:hypothetical protein